MQFGLGLATAPATMAEPVLEPIEALRSDARLKQLAASGMPPEQLAEFKEQVRAMVHDALVVVYPALLVIFGAPAGGR